MSTTEDVAIHIRGSLVDLSRRVDVETAIAIARAVLRGATEALRELSNDHDRERESTPADRVVPLRPDILQGLEFGAPKH